MSDNELGHKMFKILMQSYSDSIQNGSAIVHWANKMKSLGIKIEPQIKNMMMASLGLLGSTETNLKHTEQYIVIRTSSFGDICVPRELVDRALALGFIL